MCVLTAEVGMLDIDVDGDSAASFGFTDLGESGGVALDLLMIDVEMGDIACDEVGGVDFEGFEFLECVVAVIELDVVIGDGINYFIVCDDDCVLELVVRLSLFVSCRCLSVRFRFMLGLRSGLRRRR